MDELSYRRYLRCATTTGHTWTEPDGTGTCTRCGMTITH